MTENEIIKRALALGYGIEYDEDGGLFITKKRGDAVVSVRVKTDADPVGSTFNDAIAYLKG